MGNYIQTLIEWYLTPAEAVVAFVTASAIGWGIAAFTRSKGWYSIDLFSVMVVFVLTVLGFTAIINTIPGTTHVMVVGSTLIHAIGNPYYVTTGGLSMTSKISRTAKHRNYRYMNLFSLIMMACGNLLVWIGNENNAWALMLLVFIVLHITLVIPPRNAIIAQQMLYSFKSVPKP